MAGTWQRLAHAVLGSDGDTFDTGTFTAKDNLRIIVWTKGTTGGTYQGLRFNDDTGSNYAHRRSEAGGSDGTNTSQSFMQVSDSGIANSGGYTVTDITNISGKEKLAITHSVMGSSSGAGTAPDRDEFVSKWANTSAQITKIQVYNQGSGNFVAGSYITVLGASGDITTDEKDTITNVPTGTRYEETDTRKIYRRVVSSSTGTTKAGATADSNASVSYLTYKQITGLTSGDIITAVTFDAYSYSSTAFKGGVYTDSSNQPSSLLGSGTLASGSLSNTYTTTSITLDSPVTVPSDGKVWVAIVPSTNSPNLRVTTEGSGAYTHSVYATSSSPSGSYTNYANMLYSTANISGNGSNNVRFGVTTGNVWKERGTA